MLDSILDWAAVCLPTILGIVGGLMTLKVPPAKHHRAWFIGAVLVGIAVSTITFFQQYRARQSHNEEVKILGNTLANLNSTVQSQQSQLQSQGQQVATLIANGQAEIARRQQAEKDLELYISGIGKLTRQGVSEDIKRSPISVQMNGEPVKDRSSCVLELQKFYLSIDPLYYKDIPKNVSDKDFASYISEVNAWTGQTFNWIANNMGGAAASKFQDQTGISIISWGRAANPQHNNIINLLAQLKKNLNDLIQSGAWDAPDACGKPK